MKLIQLAAIGIVSLLGTATMHAATLCPALGVATDCNIVITVGAGGTVNITNGASTAPTYDGSEDVLVGITNNSGVALSTINLSSSADIFGFDGDGIDTFGAPSNAQDNSGYGGPDSFFTNINPSATSGTVNFVTALAGNGGFTYFSLEEAVTAGQITATPSSVPEPGTLMMMGSGLAGFAGVCRRRFVK